MTRKYESHIAHRHTTPTSCILQFHLHEHNTRTRNRISVLTNFESFKNQLHAMITGRHEEPASSGHGTTTPSTIVRTAKRNPFVVQSTAAKKACGNISELPSDLITWLLMHVGAVGQWRMRAVCKIFRTLALKIDSVAVSDSSGLTEKGGRERGRESERVAERDRKRERDVYVGGSYTQEHLRMVRCTYHTHTRTHTHTHTLSRAASTGTLSTQGARWSSRWSSRWS